MVKRYGDKALEESAARADELAQDDAVSQLANMTPPGAPHAPLTK